MRIGGKERTRGAHVCTSGAFVDTYSLNVPRKIVHRNYVGSFFTVSSDGPCPSDDS